MDSKMDSSFSIVGGSVTEEEERYLLEKGLKWENSQGEIYDVSTEVEDMSSSFLSHSQQRSLILFEENERLYSEIDSKKSSNPLSESKAVELPRVGPEVISDSICSEDEDKENKAVNLGENQSCKSSLFSKDDGIVKNLENEFCEEENIHHIHSTVVSKLSDDSNGGGRILQERFSEIARSGTSSALDISIPYNETSIAEGDSDLNIVPCTQNLSMDMRTHDDEPSEVDVDLVPCTQNLSYDADFDKSVDVVPCSQFPVHDQSGNSYLDSSSALCSQTSTGTTSSKDDLDDTITTMTKLLALAEEQEKKEKWAEAAIARLNAITPDSEKIEHESASDVEVSNSVENADCPVESGAVGNVDSSGSTNKTDAGVNSDRKTVITPLKHSRVAYLKGKNLCTPSPPRHTVDSLLKRGLLKKNIALGAQQKIDKINKDSPNTSTPKRAPLANITPAKKLGTPKGVNTPKNGKTPVVAKVDSGLRRSPFSVGLSPVANYIYSKPAPSTFVRVPGISKSNIKPPSSFSRPATTMTKIPLPPPSRNQVQTNSSTSSLSKTTTPASASKLPKPHSNLRTSTYFNMNFTPPKIVLNEKSDGKRFQPLKYAGATKVKAVNGKPESPSTGFVAHRHTGLRDESGNASFIQNATIQNLHIPAHARPAVSQNTK